MGCQHCLGSLSYVSNCCKIKSFFADLIVLFILILNLRAIFMCSGSPDLFALFRAWSRSFIISIISAVSHSGRVLLNVDVRSGAMISNI